MRSNVRSVTESNGLMVAAGYKQKTLQSFNLEVLILTLWLSRDVNCSHSTICAYNTGTRSTDDYTI